MTKTRKYQERFYRKWVHSPDLITQNVVVKETDVFISATKDLRGIAEKAIKKYRAQIEMYIKDHPEFLTSLKPIEPDFNHTTADIVKDMIIASTLADVGPMASVAGAIAEFVGMELLKYSDQIIVENGGDIFIKSKKERLIAIYAGDSSLTGRLCIKIKPEDMPLGICTSSGTVGHSLSFGKADACVIISTSTSLADAVATAACNRVKDKDDIVEALDYALSIKGIKAGLIIYKNDMGVKGDIELV